MSADESTGRIRPGTLDEASHFEQQQDTHQTKEKERRRARLKAAFEVANEGIVQGESSDACTIIEDIILPELPITRRNARDYDRELAGSGHKFYYALVDSVLASGADSGDLSTIDLERVLESLESVAVTEGVLPNSLPENQAVVEYQHQIGVRHLSGKYAVSPVLEAIDAGGDYKATLCAGSTGSGKSASLRTLAEDRYANGHKIVDLVELKKAENATYDIPSQNELGEIRAEKGFDVGFEECERPPMDVLVPMTTDLENARIPFDEETGETIVRPFTIPASELSYRQIVMLMPKTTDVWEQAILSAHQKLDNKGRDWTLEDLVDEVHRDPQTTDRVSQRIEGALRTVQNKGFIRDQQCPHTLNWRDIMAAEENITAFTVYQLQSKLDKLLVISYLIDSLSRERDKLQVQGRMQEFAPLTAILREMHYVAPRNKSENDSQRSVESVMIENLQEFFAVMRHANAEILADTQQFYRQLDPGVSEKFDRIYCFGGHKSDVKHIFNTRVSPNGSPEEHVARYSDGRCALVSSKVGYKMPIQFAPPRAHHLDAKTEGDGFSFRTQVEELDEEMREIPWDVSLPDRLGFNTGRTDPVERFAEVAIVVTNDRTDYAFKDELTAAYNKWAEAEEESAFTNNQFHRRLKNLLDLNDDTDAQIQRNGKRTAAHRTIELKDTFRLSDEDIQTHYKG